MSEIDTFLWWRILNYLSKNKSSAIESIFFLDELKEEREGELYYEQVILINLKSYIYNSSFLIDNIGKDLKRLIVLFKRFLNFIKTKYQKSLTSSAKQRILRNVPWRELNSIFWIMTQCKVYQSYVQISEGIHSWKSARKETDPLYIKSNPSILRMDVSNVDRGEKKGPLMVCLQRIEKFIKNKENFTFREQQELLNFYIIEPEIGSDSESESGLDSFFYYFL